MAGWFGTRGLVRLEAVALVMGWLVEGVEGSDQGNHDDLVATV